MEKSEFEVFSWKFEGLELEWRDLRTATEGTVEIRKDLRWEPRIKRIWRLRRVKFIAVFADGDEEFG